MLSISHATVGAFIATSVENPALSIPLILASHYLLDAVPHWDAGTGLGNGSKSVGKALLLELPDLLLAGTIVLLFFLLPQIWGAFLGLLPDFLEAPRNFLKYEPAVLRPLNKFHHAFHHSIPHLLPGLAPQIILLLTIWFYR
ncbi:MAG: hypothetical protein UY18_C0004G0034 [Microgenomates group bacterium GW2011_GWF2_47_9]|nr:MAG: hypothetical protein UY18_C0004G0034 [Microgenomates group bacterium GW2011_GWF2_47_9]